jgi:hypothetical protein
VFVAINSLTVTQVCLSIIETDIDNILITWCFEFIKFYENFVQTFALDYVNMYIDRCEHLYIALLHRNYTEWNMNKQNKSYKRDVEF